MKDSAKKYLKYAVSVLLAAVLLYFCFRGVAWKDFAQGLKDCRWGLVVLSMLCGAGAFFFRGMRWRRMLLPVDPSTRRIVTYDATTIGNISNFVFPYLGEIVRAGVVARNARVAAQRRGEGEEGLHVDKVFGTIAMDRMWDLLSLALMFGLLLAFKWSVFGDFFAEKIWGPLSERFSGAVWIIVIAAVTAVVGICFCIAAFRTRSRVCAKICSFMGGLWKGFASCLKMEHKWVFILQTVLIWLCYWLQIVFCFDAMALDLGLVDALFIMLVGSVASLVPVPGGFGAYHYLVALSLSTLYGLPWQTGIVFATLAHESQAITMILTGGVSYLHQIAKK